VACAIVAHTVVGAVATTRASDLLASWAVPALLTSALKRPHVTGTVSTAGNSIGITQITGAARALARKACPSAFTTALPVTLATPAATAHTAVNVRVASLAFARVTSKPSHTQAGAIQARTLVVAVINATHDLALLALERIIALALIHFCSQIQTTLPMIRAIGFTGLDVAACAAPTVVTIAAPFGKQAGAVLGAVFGASSHIASLTRVAKNTLAFTVDASTFAIADLAVRSFPALEKLAGRDAVADLAVLVLLAVAFAKTVTANAVAEAGAIAGACLLLAVGLQAAVFACAHAVNADAVATAVIGTRLLRTVFRTPLLLTNALGSFARSMTTAVIWAHLCGAIVAAEAMEASTGTCLMLANAVVRAIVGAQHARAIVSVETSRARAVPGAAIASTVSAAVVRTRSHAAIGSSEALLASADAAVIVAGAAARAVVGAHLQLANGASMRRKALALACLGVALAITIALGAVGIGRARLELARVAGEIRRTGTLEVAAGLCGRASSGPIEARAFCRSAERSVKAFVALAATETLAGTVATAGPPRLLVAEWQGAIIAGVAWLWRARFGTAEAHATLTLAPPKAIIGT